MITTAMKLSATRGGSQKKFSTKKLQDGLTLVELVISIVIISIVTTGLLSTQATVAARSSDPMLARQAQAVAEAQLNEILARDYLDPTTGTVCPPPPSNRSLYDNVCDYDGLPDTVVRDEFGNDLGLTGYGVVVSVEPSSALNGLSSANALFVNVVVTNPQGRTSSLSGYRTKY